MKRPTQYICWVRWLRREQGKAEPIENVKLLAEVHWKPETILNQECQKVRACGSAFMTIPKYHDVWPIAGLDRLKIRERVYRILAVQVAEVHHEQAHIYNGYQVFLR